ncbi:hypothetical protein TK90_2870 (plasmid) [Thioalkalivibrio sp. K90mix]|uniref:RecB family exonuclease n=1 Tax=Thioalkalivibrio sp. (strain K90mix) TaxID=396595 RepID=UPI000195A946|nr:PD-(D/E)XK nuclease family protein [Thioalkalivibrio sp. K90mix]ADC73354.1 hypothetical protein TK90_2870 [Thioalkalivibrio sp. K90mix]
MRVRPTSALKYEDCPRKYYFSEVLKIRPLVQAANLAFGKVLHKTLTDWLEDWAYGQAYTGLGEQFKESWQVEVEKAPIEYSTTLGPEQVPAVGGRLADQFEERWETFELDIVFDASGKPLVERRFEVDLGEGVVLSTQPDLVVIDKDGFAGPLDLKTAAQQTDEAFVEQADQLTAQEIAIEAHAEDLLLSGVDRVGFGEMLKKPIPRTKQGTGPQVLDPVFSPARSKEVKDAYRQKVIWISEDIERGRFPARSRMAYNSPCSLCDYRGLCKDGDATGLRIPGTSHQKLAA